MQVPGRHRQSHEVAPQYVHLPALGRNWDPYFVIEWLRNRENDTAAGETAGTTSTFVRWERPTSNSPQAFQLMSCSHPLPSQQLAHYPPLRTISRGARYKRPECLYRET